MTDRELLELAAKAAGIEYGWQHIYDDYEGSTSDKWDWNPLIDDGDALRLAVKLGLPLVFSKITDARIPVVACHKEYVNVHEEEVWQWLFIKDDPYAATRLAIVRAAAAIGETM